MPVSRRPAGSLGSPHGARSAGRGLPGRSARPPRRGRGRPLGLPVHLQRHRLRRLHRDPGQDHPLGGLVPGVGSHRDALRAARRGRRGRGTARRPPRVPGSAPPWPGTGASSSSSTTRYSSAPRTSGASPASSGPRPALTPPAELVHVPYGDTTLPAYLRVPAAAGFGNAPVVIMVPGLDSTKEELQATAEYFLARGLATLAVDGPGQGESEYELPIEPAYEKVATAAVDYLQDRAGLDREQDRPVRREPRRLLRRPFRGLREAPAGGRRARRPVPLRPGLGRAPTADQGHLPGPLGREVRRRRPRQGRQAHPRRGRRAHRHPAAHRRRRPRHDRPRLPPGAPGQRR